MAIRNPTATASLSFSVSKEATTLLQEAIRSGDSPSVMDHEFHCMTTLTAARTERESWETELLSSILDDMASDRRRTLKRIVDGDCSGWLTVLPLAAEGFDLSATQFRDQLALRYHHTPTGFPAICDGCGSDFTVQHALDCRKAVW